MRRVENTKDLWFARLPGREKTANNRLDFSFASVRNRRAPTLLVVKWQRQLSSSSAWKKEQSHL
jgi:hypothetical protein